MQFHWYEVIVFLSIVLIHILLLIELWSRTKHDVPTIGMNQKIKNKMSGKARPRRCRFAVVHCVFQLEVELNK